MREWPMSTSEILMMQEMPSMRRAGLSCLTSLPWWRLCMSLPAGRSMKVEEMLEGPTVCPLPGMVGVGEWNMEDQEHQIDTETTGIEEDHLQEEAEMISEDLQEEGTSEMKGGGEEVLQEDPPEVMVVDLMTAMEDLMDNGLQEERIRRTSSLTTWTT